MHEVSVDDLDGLPQVADGHGIDAMCPLGVQLASVHVGPGGAVHDEFGPECHHGLVDRFPISHVQGSPCQADHAPATFEHPHHLAAQLAAGTGHQHGHGRSPSSGSHQEALSRYQATVAANPSARPWTGAHPRARIRCVSTE